MIAEEEIESVKKQLRNGFQPQCLHRICDCVSGLNLNEILR